MKRSLLLGLALTAFSLALHFLPIWETMLNRGPETWDGQPLPHDYIEQCIQDHRQGAEIAFARRPLTTWSIDALTTIGLPAKTAFILLGFGLFLLAGLLIHRIAEQLGAQPGEALIAQAAFHLSPTVLFAWFDPLYTYDEPIQYAALLVALLALLRGQHVIFSLSFTIALIARETSVLLLPGLVWLARDTRRRSWPAFVAPLLLFALFTYWIIERQGITDPTLADLGGRLGFITFNFGTLSMAGESLCYLTLALALPSFLLYRHGRSDASSPADRAMIQAFWITLVLNTLVVLFAAKAREARLFALPMILGWPLLGKAIMDELRRAGGIGSILSFMRQPLLAIAFVVKAVVLSIAVYRFFSLSTGIEQDNLFHEYLIAELLLILVCLYAGKYRKRSKLHSA
ncbi:MAG: hypothetical protein H6591_04195 [Flavobacteriales bacterium]|nr:hypothetical protein [Flavobacteriales bacterium]